MRWQSTWPAKDIFHEYALDFAKKVNDMSGGDLKIEVLPAGAVVKAFGLLDAVSKGTLDGGHGVVAYWYGKNSRLALWNSGPAFGMDAEHGAGLAQLRRRQADCSTSSTSASTTTCSPSSTARCRRSRWAGSRSRSPR
jgi:TRAP-type mannitol/chloroaromatic compound transport system substrate-binding protein